MAKCMTVCTGDMNVFITAQKPMMQSDGQGGQITEWVEHFTFWAKVESGGGSEKWKADKLQATTMDKITAYYDSRMSPEHRLLYNGEFFNVRHSDNWNYRNQWMIIDAESGVGS